MSGEFLFRYIVFGLALGVPAYVVGMLHYAGHSIPKAVVWSVGGVAGALAGTVVTAGAAPWPAVVLVTTVLTISCGLMLPMALEAQDRFRPPEGK